MGGDAQNQDIYEATRIVEAMMAEPHGLAIARSFPRIRNREVQRCLAEIAATMAATDGDGQEPPPRHSTLERRTSEARDVRQAARQS